MNLGLNLTRMINCFKSDPNLILKEPPLGKIADEPSFHFPFPPRNAVVHYYYFFIIIIVLLGQFNFIVLHKHSHEDKWLHYNCFKPTELEFACTKPMERKKRRK